jgi:MoxR-like ATPase
VVKRYVNFGASVRATMFLNLAAKASALLEGRYHVTQEDVRKMALPVLRHRVLCNYFAESDNMTVDDVLTQMLEKVEA